MRIALYCKRTNSHFPFSYIIRSVSEVLHIGMKWRCFILWSFSETMLHRQAFMKHGFAVWSGTLCHEAHLRCMKRSLTASCFFALFQGKKNGRPFSLNSEFSLKLKRLQVNKSWSLFRQLAKISLFSAFFETEKNFLLNQKDFFSETTAKCTETQLNLRL